MPLNLPAPPPPFTIVGAATLPAPFTLGEVVGILPDAGDSDTLPEFISLAATVNKFAAMPLSSLLTNYGIITSVMDVNSPTLDEDSTNSSPYCVRMSNAVETMDRNKYNDKDSINYKFMVSGYVDSDYVKPFRG